MENPDQILLPSGDFVLIGLHVEESRGNIPFTLLDDLLLNPGHGSAIRTLGERNVQR